MSSQTSNVLMSLFLLFAILVIAGGLVRCQTSKDACKADCLKTTNRPVVECYLGCT